MTLARIDWIIVAVYFVLSLSVGLMFTRRAGRSTENYFLQSKFGRGGSPTPRGSGARRTRRSGRG